MTNRDQARRHLINELRVMNARDAEAVADILSECVSFGVGSRVMGVRDCVEQMREGFYRPSPTRCPVHDMQEHGREAAELCEGIERIIAGADEDDDVPADELRKLLDSVDARDSLAYLERKERTRWNPPGTPYPPAQDGATLLVWSTLDIFGLRITPPDAYRCYDGDWGQYIGLDTERNEEVWEYPADGHPWLLIPDPEQGEHSPGHDPDAAPNAGQCQADPPQRKEALNALAKPGPENGSTTVARSACSGGATRAGEANVLGDDATGRRPSLSHERALLLLRFAVRHAGRHSVISVPRWVHVKTLCGVGSTTAHQLCRDAGVDPDELVGGCLCGAAEVCPLHEDEGVEP